MKFNKHFTAAAFLFATVFATQASAQDYKCTSWEAYPGGVKEARTQHIIYRDLFNAQKYAEALEAWKPLFEHVTSPAEANARHFEDGATMYYNLAVAATDPAIKKSYTEEMNKIYDHKAKCLGENITDRSYQAYYMYYLQYDALKTVAALDKVLEMGKEKTPYFVLTPMAALSVYLFQQKHPDFTNERLINLYNTLKDISEKNTSDENYQATWGVIESTFKPIESQIFGCDYFVAQVEEAFRANPDDKDENYKYLATIQTRCGKEHPLFVEIETKYLAQKAAEMESKFDSIFDASNAYEKAVLLQSRGDKGYIQWYIKAFETKDGFPESAGVKEKSETAMRIADSYYRSNNYGSARTWARKAAEIRPNWGQPYIFVGILYASSGKMCGPGTGWDSQVVIWAAMDEWQKARSVDASVAGEANRLINKYTEFLPMVSDAHFRNIKDGASYKIDCWINTTTTVRLKK